MQIIAPVSFLFSLLFLLICPLLYAQGAELGDWGHFLSYTPTMHFNNFDGREFTITVNAMRWANPSWNRDQAVLRLLDPEGRIIVDGPQNIIDAAITLEVTEAVKGVYTLHAQGSGLGGFRFSTSLPQAVVWTGTQGATLIDYNDTEVDEATGMLRTRQYYDSKAPVVFQAVVPRRWWFWVPEDVTAFTAESVRDGMCMSQREDWGFFIISPRGQRIRALWGQPPHRSHASGEYTQRQRVEVEVEPGAAGRFWCLEVSNGDSHQYSNINIAFDGIPPYLARSPEEWFDPREGKAPQVPVYDHTPFMQAAQIEGELSFQQLHHKRKDPAFAWPPTLEHLAQRWPNLEQWSPCPSLGDPDGVEILGNARVALWNPDGLDLRFRIGTYITRRPSSDPDVARVTVTGSSGETVFDKSLPVLHIHDSRTSGPNETIQTGRGVAYVTVSDDVERWLCFTYPATPLVLIGEDAGEWKRFRFTAAAPRNWYFFVPEHVREFDVRFAVDFPTDVLHLEICAPDRTQALLYAGRGEHTVNVPDGLGGKIWYLRPSVGSSTQIITDKGPDYRHQDIPLTLDIRGVPGYLSPTWEQWFNPETAGQ